MTIKNTLEGKIKYRIKRSKLPVFILSDFTDLSDKDQVGRVLRKLVSKKILIKIGQGVYARTIKSILNEEYIPEKDINTLAREALKKYGVKVVDSDYEMAYNSGQTTQVPTGRVIGVLGRVSRKIGYNGRFVKYQKVSTR